MGRNLYPFLPVRLLIRFEYDTESYLAHVACPVAVIHSPDDEIVPFEHGRSLFKKARNPREFIRIRGSHNYGFLESGTDYTEALARLLVD